jgi:myo-inositol 2-dehydrogenase / D-chiro-inositol 1-dehydrogenase
MNTNRRDFLKTASVGAAALGAMSIVNNAYAAGSDVIKVGLIGCGGRGSDAAMNNVLASAPNVKIVTIGDVFRDKVDHFRKVATGKHPDKVELPDDRCYVGLNAYEKVLAEDINYVILATPPGFRPVHLEAAVKAGKNIFTEKPVAVDGPGIRKVLAAYEEAKKKNLCIVAGTQRRHQAGYLETIKRLHDGAIGDIVAARCYWNGKTPWFHNRKEGMSDAQYQIHNWYHFCWLCGDHICEQHVHNLDVINWVLQQTPKSAVGLGGRAMRPAGDPKDVGNIYDHFAVEYTYPNGLVMSSYCRHMPGVDNISEAVVGTKGKSQINDYLINGKQVFSGQETNPYIQEHTDLIAAIRKGEVINELKTVAESTLTAILGRMATYSGDEVTWETALTSPEDSFPKDLTLDGSLDTAPVPMPGQKRRPRASRGG